MRSEFDTLEQYQESMKEFNENTRMGFEEFIQSHGSDRNKLQLRCTPYTSKKGGYGSFDLDFGLCVYQHQQSKVDELQNNINLLTEALDVKEQLNQKLREREDELQKRVDAALKLIESWNEIAFDKTTHWTEGYEEGCYHCAAQLEQALKGGEA